MAAGDWEDFVHVNITGTRVLLCCAQEAGVQNVVFVSSPSVAHAGTSIEGVGAEPANPRTARGHYADEALWAAQLHWAAPTETMTAAKTQRLIEACQAVMRRALDAGGTSFDSLYVNVNGESGHVTAQGTLVVHGDVFNGATNHPVGHAASYYFDLGKFGHQPRSGWLAASRVSRR